ncbi:MAG: hypothetical protein HYX47_18765 [Burkholderiales bacterium]|nr:hypothetical protein [Burkholderiales bacterium]
MTAPLAETLGPPPFRFIPSQGPSIEGPAFSPAFKLLASALVFGTAGWFVQLWLAGKVSGGAVSIFTWFLAAMCMMLYTWWCIVRSVTRLDGQDLQQTWMWNKKMELRELAYGKLIRVRGFDWLIAPRLYVRTLMGKFAVFYATDPAMIAEFERLVAELKAFRGFK